jgi:hypothetical protein
LIRRHPPRGFLLRQFATVLNLDVDLLYFLTPQVPFDFDISNVSEEQAVAAYRAFRQIMTGKKTRTAKINLLRRPYSNCVIGRVRGRLSRLPNPFIQSDCRKTPKLSWPNLDLSAIVLTQPGLF